MFGDLALVEHLVASLDRSFLLLFVDLVQFALGWVDVLVVAVGEPHVVILPVHVREERMLFYLLSAVEAQTGHWVPDH